MLKVVLKRWEVFKAEESLELIGMLKLNKKVSYALAKNARVVQQEARDLRSIKDLRKIDSERWNKRLSQYQRRATKIEHECALKNSQGYPLRQSNGGYSIEDPGKFETLMLALDDEYPDVAAARDANDSEYDMILQEEVTLDLHGISFEFLPEEFALKSLGPLVEAVVMGFDSETTRE